MTEINWQHEYESLIRSIGSATYGKERWFLQDDGTWYDRKYGDYITTQTLENMIFKELEEL